MRHRHLRPFPSIMAAIVPGVLFAPSAFAVTSLAGGSFGAGFSGPLLLVPVLVGLLSVGLWSTEQGARAPWHLAVAAVAGVVLAGLLTQWGVRVPYAGLLRDGSLVVIGGLIALRVQLPDPIALALVTVSGAALGIALAGWAGAVSVPLLFWLGALSGGLLATAAGIGLASQLSIAFSDGAIRAVGVGVALVGILAMMGLV